ncbi:MAG: endonuclease/exonuclease/phosphatase family protein [Clostridiales bacterium]|nr:endonuclease/exonuclease/phosphatase family protein [Clostridiales bacterium]
MARKVCTLNVGSFNIGYDNRKAEQGWEKRKEFVVSLVRFHEFDVFGTQEGCSYQLKDIAGNTYDYVYVNGFWNKNNPDIAPEKSQHNGIFWLKDKFKLLDTGNFWLSETPDKKSFGWDAAESRGCVWVKLKEQKSGKTFFFFCVHLDHRGVEARQNSVLLILEKMQEIAKGMPVFCVGDFNGDPESAHIQTIRSSGFLFDSRLVTQTPPYGTIGTFNGYKKDSSMKGNLDYIWVTKDIQVKKYGVLNDMPYLVSLSDHFPILIKAEM